MNDYLQAADDANRLLRGFAGVQTLADTFAKVGGLQQAADEATARLRDLEGKVADAKNALGIANAAIDNARAEAAAVLFEASGQASAIKAAAEAAAAEKIAAADAVLAQAKAEAQRVKDEASAHVTAAETSHAGLKVSVSALEDKLATLREQAKHLLGQ